MAKKGRNLEFPILEILGFPILRSESLVGFQLFLSLDSMSYP